GMKLEFRSIGALPQTPSHRPAKPAAVQPPGHQKKGRVDEDAGWRSMDIRDGDFPRVIAGFKPFANPLGFCPRIARDADALLARSVVIDGKQPRRPARDEALANVLGDD